MILQDQTNVCYYISFFLSFFRQKQILLIQHFIIVLIDKSITKIRVSNRIYWKWKLMCFDWKLNKNLKTITQITFKIKIAKTANVSKSSRICHYIILNIAVFDLLIFFAFLLLFISLYLYVFISSCYIFFSSFSPDIHSMVIFSADFPFVSYCF